MVNGNISTNFVHSRSVPHNQQMNVAPVKQNTTEPSVLNSQAGSEESDTIMETYKATTILCTEARGEQLHQSTGEHQVWDKEIMQFHYSSETMRLA